MAVGGISGGGSGGGGGGGGTAGGAEVNHSAVTLSPGQICMKDPHWYAFLCSSFITFFTGLLLVLSWRILAWVVCQKNGGGIGGSSAAGGTAANAAAAAGGGKKTAELDAVNPADTEVGWVTEAKDWAGELISGQTTTGRILVRNCDFSIDNL